MRALRREPVRGGGRAIAAGVMATGMMAGETEEEGADCELARGMTEDVIVSSFTTTAMGISTSTAEDEAGGGTEEEAEAEEAARAASSAPLALRDDEAEGISREGPTADETEGDRDADASAGVARDEATRAGAGAAAADVDIVGVPLVGGVGAAELLREAAARAAVAALSMARRVSSSDAITLGEK